MLAPAFVDPHVHLRVPGREDEETIATGTAAAAAGGYCAILAMPNTEPVIDSAAVLGSLIEDAQARGRGSGRLPRVDHARPRGRRADRDGRARRPGRGRLHGRRPPGRRAGPDAPRAPVPRDHRPAARAPLRGADALEGRPDARRRGLGRARLRRVPVGRREPDGRARPRARRVRAGAAAPAPPLGARVGRGAARGAGERGAGDRGGDAAPPLPDRRGGPSARPEREDEPAAAVGRRPLCADRRPEGRHDRQRRHRSRPARAAREGGAVRGGARSA